MNAGQLPSIPQHMPPSFGIKNSVTVRFCNEGGMRKQRNIKALREKGISNKIKKKEKVASNERTRSPALLHIMQSQENCY